MALSEFVELQGEEEVEVWGVSQPKISFISSMGPAM